MSKKAGEHLEIWKIAQREKGRPLHKASYGAPMSPSSNDDKSSDPEPPLSKLVMKCRKQRKMSFEESDIPLMELAK